jgi:hypothetical protein
VAFITRCASQGRLRPAEPASARRRPRRRGRENPAPAPSARRTASALPGAAPVEQHRRHVRACDHEYQPCACEKGKSEWTPPTMVLTSGLEPSLPLLGDESSPGPGRLADLQRGARRLWRPAGNAGHRRVLSATAGVDSRYPEIRSIGREARTRWQDPRTGRFSLRRQLSPEEAGRILAVARQHAS